MAKQKKSRKSRTKVADPDKVTLTELYPDAGEADADEYDEGYIRRWILQCREEAKTAKWDRMQQNKMNFDLYHARHDFSHKLPGQSQETLNMQAMAIESTCSFFQQALIDEGDWWDVRALDPANEDSLKVKPDVVKDLVQYELNKAGMLRHVGLGIKSGLLGALWISKVHGEYKSIPAYTVNRDPNSRKARLKNVSKKSWQLKLDVTNQQHYYPDPTGADLYEIDEMWTDYHVICALAQGPDAIYDEDVVEELEGLSEAEDGEEQLDERRQTGQNTVSHDFRKRVKLTEYWGSILGEDGEIIAENVICTLANDKFLIRPPTPNTNWHQESSTVRIPIIDLPDAVWPKALADAGTRHNMALNEIYNLMLDGAMRSVNGIGMIRQDWLDDPTDVENGIPPGTTFKVNAQCPPGAKVYEVVQSGTLPPDAQNMFNIQRQEFNASMLTSDIRSGIQPRRDVPATQIVETSQSITSVFKGICEQIEQNGIKPILMKAVQTVMQFSDEIDESEVRAVLGDRADDFLKLTPEERFAETVQGVKFEVYGISQHLAKAQDFQKIATLLQTIGASQPFMEAFISEYDPSRVLRQAMKALGINVRAIEIPQAQKEMMQQSQQGQQGQPAAPQGPDQMSQVGSPNTGSLADQLGSAAGPQIPQASFPRTRATPKGGF